MIYHESMDWEVETEPEVDQWLNDLTDEQFGHAEFYIDLLAERGRGLREPYTRQLDGKLRELRFYMGRTRQRISYYHARGRVIVLLTVFSKTADKEPAQIRRAKKAMQKCITEGHVEEEEL